MPETVVTTENGETEVTTPAEASAHEAAVAEGATAVQAEQATEAAEEAKAAAEVALDAAKVNVESGAAVEQAAERAEGSAAAASVSLETIHEALTAQGKAIEALTAELKAGRKQAPPAESKSTPPERQPAETHPFYRKIGGR